MSSPAITPFDQRIRIGLLRIGAIVLLPLLVVSRPYFNEEGVLIDTMEVLGFTLIVACVLGRFWSILYVGRHKNRAVVVEGPYSITRNPLYFFSTLGAVGFGLVFAKLSLALVLGGLVFTILYLTARREQAFLEGEFGPAYVSYAARVPMFVPDVRLFTTPATIVVSAGALRRSLLDAFVFLAAIPLAELSETLLYRVDLPRIVLP